MPMTCVAFGCNNHFVKGCGKQFFRFPIKDPDRLSRWVLAIRRKNWKPSASSRICSDHFTENDYMLRPGAMVPRLRLDAVPSVFEGFPNHLKERLERKKTLRKKSDEHVIVIGNQHGGPGPHVQPSASLDPVEPKETNAPGQNSEINSIPVLKSSSPQIKQEPESDGDEKISADAAKTCAVRGCRNTWYEGCQRLFFRFPVSDPELLSKWLAAMRGESRTSSTSRSICSDHFTEKDYILYPGDTVPQLGPGAVPSLFIVVPAVIQAADTQEGDPTGNGEPAERAKDPILVPSEILKTKLHEISNKERKRQVTRGPLERSRAVTCVVHGCNSVFLKGCGKRFFRFPMKNPVRLSKWIKALHRSDWKPSAFSRICSDHFKDKNYILRPGVAIPRLRSSAVPSVCKARKSRRKPITTTDQDFRHCRPTEGVDGFQERETHRPCDHTYSAAHGEDDLPRYNPDTVRLKLRVRTLQRQIQRQRHTIRKLSERITQLKSGSAPLHHV